MELEVGGHPAEVRHRNLPHPIGQVLDHPLLNKHGGNGKKRLLPACAGFVE
jgi:hypothetical protein